ncbi:MAG: hypothetical protein JWR69_2084 [Pedosphaera sp.]|nr:hypothetical protein [Pedosphaera sp.]
MGNRGGNKLEHRKRCLNWFLVLLLMTAGTIAKADDLQGQSAGSTNWFTGTLQGWKELDYVPGKAVLTGGPFNSKVVVINFDHTKGGLPAIEFLTGFTPSANVLITSGPTLTAPAGVDTWSYTLTVRLLDKNAGAIQFWSRLSAGSHVSAGASIRFSSKTLQIAKPGAALGSPDLAIVKKGPALSSPGGTITYTINYTNKTSTFSTATGVQLTDTLPNLVAYVPGSAAGPVILLGNNLTWDLGNLPPGVSGSVSYQVTVKTNAAIGQTFTGVAMIASAENNANCGDDNASVTTLVAQPNLPPAILQNPVTSINYSGKPISFSVLASGTGPLTFQWRKNGSTIPGATQSCFTLTTAGDGDAGSYDVVVTNIAGVATSSAAMVGIEQKISSGKLLPDKSFALQLASLPNRSYSVQYSSDLVNWKTAQTGITGDGTVMQWIDDGAPKTECAPAATSARFYKVVLLPQSGLSRAATERSDDTGGRE